MLQALSRSPKDQHGVEQFLTPEARRRRILRLREAKDCDRLATVDKKVTQRQRLSGAYQDASLPARRGVP